MSSHSYISDTNAVSAPNLTSDRRHLFFAFLGSLLLLLVLILIVVRPLSHSTSPTSESSSRLSKMLAQEQEKITSAFASRFSFLKEGEAYTIEKTVLLSDSTYAVILLTVNQTTYRALLTTNPDPNSDSSDHSWRVLNLPAPVLTYSDFSNIPASIIKSANNLTL